MATFKEARENPMTFAQILATDTTLTHDDLLDFASFMDLETSRDFMEDVANARR